MPAALTRPGLDRKVKSGPWPSARETMWPVPPSQATFHFPCVSTSDEDTDRHPGTETQTWTEIELGMD